MTSKDTEPLISIIIPSFNHARYLPETLSSVVNQTYKKWECIVVDDGSTDETEELALEWKKKDQRIKFVKKENGGLSNARNTGLKNSSGEFIQFLDSDDILLPSKLQAQLSLLRRECRLQIVYCDYKVVRDEPNIILSEQTLGTLPTSMYGTSSLYEILAHWETRVTIPSHSFLLSRAFFDDGLKFDESLTNHEDWDCWVQAYGAADLISYVPEKLVIYRYRSDSMSRNVEQMRQGFVKAIEKNLSASQDPFLRELLQLKKSEMNLYYDLKTTERHDVESTLSILSCIAKTQTSRRYEKIFIWGGGEFGKRIEKFLTKNLIEVNGILSSRVSISNFGICSKEMPAQATLIAEQMKCLVLIASTFQGEIIRLINSSGLKGKHDFIFLSPAIMAALNDY